MWRKKGMWRYLPKLRTLIVKGRIGVIAVLERSSIEFLLLTIFAGSPIFWSTGVLLLIWVETICFGHIPSMLLSGLNFTGLLLQHIIREIGCENIPFYRGIWVNLEVILVVLGPSAISDMKSRGMGQITPINVKRWLFPFVLGRWWSRAQTNLHVKRWILTFLKEFNFLFTFL